MAGHSRLKDGVTSARLSPAIHAFLAGGAEDVDARHKAGHDGEKWHASYGAGTVIGLPLSTMCTVNSFSVLSPTTL
jgi:hypothetical protein